MRTTGSRARRAAAPKRDTLRSLRLGAIWTALPVRDQHLLLWLLSADIVTSRLAALLVYGQLRIAQRRLSRLVELGVLRGFWAASAQRPRGRYAYGLTRAARLDLERLAWPDGPPDRGPDLLPSVPGHQLATHDLLAAFLTSAAPDIPEGLAVWIPERACGRLFGGFLRPDAVAGIQVGQHALTLFIERDLGTERGEALGQKLRRYDTLFGRIHAEGVRVGFVADSVRRGRRFVQSAIRLYGTSTPFVAAEIYIGIMRLGPELDRAPINAVLDRFLSGLRAVEEWPGSGQAQQPSVDIVAIIPGSLGPDFEGICLGRVSRNERAAQVQWAAKPPHQLPLLKTDVRLVPLACRLRLASRACSLPTQTDFRWRPRALHDRGSGRKRALDGRHGERP